MPSAEDQDAFSLAYARLATSALSTNRGRSDVLARVLARVGSGVASVAELDEAARTAHQLAGSAGTFGHRQASARALALEQFFRDPARGPLAQAEVDLAALRADLDRPQTDLG